MNQAAPLMLPRWEWRTFSPSLADIRAALAGSPQLGCEEDYEIRLLCPRSRHDVLIKGETLQLKWCKQIGPKGLELWDPVLHSSFPCPSVILLRLFGALGLTAPRLDRVSYSRTQFLEEFLPLHPVLQAVHLQRHSQTFLLDGVSCEMTELQTDSVRIDTFSIEHEDPELTFQVLHRLGIQARCNTSYPQGLKAALHFPTQH